MNNEPLAKMADEIRKSEAIGDGAPSWGMVILKCVWFVVSLPFRIAWSIATGW